MDFVVVLISPLILFVLGAYHDYLIWKASDADKYKFTKQWHKVDLAVQIIIFSSISYIHFNCWQLILIYLIYVGCMRIMLFNGVYNTLRDDAVYYFSADSNLIDKILGKTPRLSYYGLSVLGVLLLLILTLIKLI